MVQRLLDASANLPAFVNHLLEAQAVTVAGTEAAGFLIERQEEQVGLRPIAHIRPDSSSPETRAAAIAAFQEIIKPCIEQSRDGAIEIGAPTNDRDGAQFCLVTLLRSEGEIAAVSAVVTRCVNPDRARQRLQSMQLVAGYFELYTLRRTSEQSRIVAQSHQHVLQLATSVATAEGFESAAMNLCNELATRSSATRVSLGWLKGRNIKVKALSHTEQFDKKQELVVQLEKAMEECLDQEAIVQYDPTTGGKSSDNVTRSAQALSRAQGGQIVLSLPLRQRAEIVGVVTLEFLPNQQLGPQVANGLAIAVELLAPQLYDRYQNDRWLITKAGLSVRDTASMAIGPKHMVAKLVTVLVIGLVLFACLFKITFRVTAPFQFVTVFKQSVSAPNDGIIKALGEINGEPIHTGMRVKKGDLLVQLRTEQLETERNKVRSEVLRWEQEEGKARGEDKIPEQLIARSRRLEAQAQLALLEDQIARATIVSPVDGEILKGELEDKIGAPVKEGDVLFEVGPRDDLKVELTVNERDVEYLRDGRDAQGLPLPDEQKQRGQLATTSSPSEKFGFKIDRIVPMGEPKEANNIFKVYATLDGSSPDWRPGLQGEAKIDVAPKPLVWIWTHRLIDFVRLKLWI